VKAEKWKLKTKVEAGRHKKQTEREIFQTILFYFSLFRMGSILGTVF